MAEPTSRAHALSQSLMMHDKTEGYEEYKKNPRPHLIMVEDERNDEGAICGAAVTGSTEQVLAMFLSLGLKVAESIDEDSPLGELHDPVNLFKLMGEMAGDKKLSSMVREVEDEK